MAIIFPVTIFLVFGIIQFGVWYHAADIARAAAQEGARTASAYHSTATAGAARAQQVLDEDASGLITNPAVVPYRGQNVATVTVTGRALQVIPFIPLPVHRVGHRTGRGLPAPTPIMTRLRRPAGDEKGSMAVELALLTVPLVAILLFVAALGRFSDARNQVDEAARDAARQASIYLTTITATEQADQIAGADLSGVCANHSVTVDTSRLRPGGQVTVTVACQVPLGDLLLLKLSGSKTVTASSTSVVDTYVQATATP